MDAIGNDDLTPEGRRLRNAAISARILGAILDGRSVPEAFDAVLGAGTYLEIAGGLYDELRARAAARGEG